MTVIGHVTGCRKSVMDAANLICHV